MKEKMPSSVQFVRGVGPRYAEVLKKLNINTVKDLLYYFPRTYQDRSQFTPIKYIRPGYEVTVQGEIIKIEENKIRKGLSILKATITDGSDVLNGVWFNQNYIKKQLKKGQTYIFSGKLNEKSFRFRKKEISNPVFEKVDKGDSIHTGRIVPIYPLTSGVTQKRLRTIIYNALNDYAHHLTDYLPGFIRKKYKFPDISRSIWGLHFPENREHYIYSRRRLAFEELFFLQLLVLKRKKGIIESRGINHKDEGEVIKKFLKLLPFRLTAAQKRVWREIKADMEKPTPMQRLLQGDVGSGKTIIAALALIETMANGYQGVFMAPTEILAEQHYLKLKDLLEPLGYRTALLVGGITGSQRENIERGIEEKKIDLIVGTHTLFQERINYFSLGLVVIDEQHRFGVEQRFKLEKKGDNPDVLVMTATPIPRTMALTIYGDLDLSIIDELPPGRSPVITTWRTQNSRKRIYSFVKEKLEEGRQAYVVCPVIEPSEELEVVSALEIKEKLEDKYLKGYNVGLLHGKLPPEEKKQVMEDFRQGVIDVLVSTTVVEVGVDVPNATIMIIENADRFGLAQLHQLRGRVGRGKYQSYCILIGNPTTEEGKRRLKVMTSLNDGFEIADEDLKIRGPGEFFGTRQHGIPDLKVASLIKDKKLLQLARQEAFNIIYSTRDWQDKYRNLKERIDELDLKI
ncbi:ATP-dependent DNA helicase RecG [Halothermothrix orenii]|uniref:ATP-dependent DNA helicase RecG n=1 Tax=Halothermothrix orenii (strain H 168 / OCM 544 / DSM 9562) TaxID=373903 RepID=B8CWU9_HALOH|nr:ATP-dependent DNA helicase RecG [Halothermothrix orenii]ACL69768.1 ATP-dependent DNA helicase RecG [Halothermothrix orenii H 168]